MTHILIIEDEDTNAKRLERLLLEKLEKSHITIRKFDNVKDALSFGENHPVDLVFLDLNLSGKDGFDFLTNQQNLRFQTIIVSAHKNRAIKAFEHNVLDFIPKPFNRERLKEALRRFFDTSSSAPRRQYIAVQHTNKWLPINVENIITIKATGAYCEIYTTLRVPPYLYQKNLDQLMQKLPPEFMRVHRSHAIAIGKIEQLFIKSGGRYSVALYGYPNNVPVGRTKIQHLKDELKI